MTTAQVSEEELDYHLLFKLSVSPPPATDEINLIEKYLKQVAAKELLGEPYVRDYVHDQKRRNCRPSTMRGNFATLVVFLSYLKQERGRTSLETLTRDDVGSFIEREQDRGMQPNTVSTRLQLVYAFLRYLVDREVVHPDLTEEKLSTLEFLFKVQISVISRQILKR